MKVILAIGWMLAFAPILAQNDSHAVSWMRYQNQIHFNKSISWFNDFDNRRFIHPDRQSQFIYHSRLFYKKNRFTYGAGLTLSWAYSSNPERIIEHPTTEVRPVVECSYELPFKEWSLQQRVMLDNRFIEENRLDPFFENPNYTLRIRHRIQARIPLKSTQCGRMKYGIRVANEIMINHRENLFDQNRVYILGEYEISKNFTAEAGYIYIYQQRFGQDEFVQRHVLRLSVIHKIFRLS